MEWFSGDANQSVHIVASEGLEAYLPLADMVDISAEVQRLSKRLTKMQAEYDGLMSRLSSPSVIIFASFCKYCHFSYFASSKIQIITHFFFADPLETNIHSPYKGQEAERTKTMTGCRT